ncbi:hypothetical protein N752_02910 [Desulforamulus aquiferis]|nr:SIMPL domain-containing protein [Desulforamulus aquiferis]RYD06637.1 hypothetical protein N752_02910 [Desulforamulus aquiferis]
MEKYSKNAYLIVAAAILAVALIICSLVMSKPLGDYASSKSSIVVTGSAKQQIRSDLALWQGSFYQESSQLPDAYSSLKTDLGKVKSYLVSKGIPEESIVVSSIYTMPQYIYSPNGMSTGQISSYRLSQSIEIRSSDVEKISAIAREATELIEQGVFFESMTPQYFYTKLNDLKIDMLAEATKDAKLRQKKWLPAPEAK